MPRRKTVYKLDIPEIERDLALARVVDDTDTLAIVEGFCKRYSLPISQEEVTNLGLQFGEIKKAMDLHEKANKSKTK